MRLTLDSPEKIAALVLALILLRVVGWLWKGMPRRASILEFIDSALVAVALVFLLVRPLLVQSYWIPSRSMYPTLLVDDKILANKFILRMQQPRRGDVVVFQAPPGLPMPHGAAGASSLFATNPDLVKRLVGLPGETVEIRAGEGVYINGRLLPEPYISGDRVPSYDMSPLLVPRDAVFVLGDNRNDSYDSHLWGTLPKRYLRGKAMLLYWPPWRVCVIQ